MQVTTTSGFENLALGKTRRGINESIEEIQKHISKFPQYEPETRHYFHGGMYCREVTRDAGVLVVGKVHKKEHFYFVASGTVAITDGDGRATEITGPRLLMSMPGTKRAVLSLTRAVCLTFHACESTTPEDAEIELTEHDESSMYDARNRVKPGVLRNEVKEVLP